MDYADRLAHQPAYRGIRNSHRPVRLIRLRDYIRKLRPHLLPLRPPCPRLPSKVQPTSAVYKDMDLCVNGAFRMVGMANTPKVPAVADIPTNELLTTPHADNVRSLRKP